MADDFKFKLELDTAAFVASLDKAKLQTQSFANEFKKSSDAASSATSSMKAALAQMVASGKGGSEEAAKLRDNIREATKAADNLADAAKSVDKEFEKAGDGGISGLAAKFKEGQAAASSGGGIFGGIAGSLGQLASPAGAATAALGLVTAGIGASIEIGKEFEQSLAGVSAVTGLTGAPLQDLGDRARDLAKQFGGDATTQLAAFQGVLSKFGADLAKTPAQLGKVSENINILAKAGGLDAAESMDVLANSMLQFGVNVADGNEAAAESGRFMNVLAASAKVGAAEIPQVGQAVLVAGVAAKGAKVSFEETNAAIQVLAAGGKVGAEAGTALRNVLGTLGKGRFLDKDSAEGLKAAGVDVAKLASKTIPLSERLAELKKITNDTALVSKVFGTENASAASILIDGAGTIKDWTAQITGTNEAQEQAAKNMATFGEAMSRLKANIEDVAISVYQFIAPALTFMANALSSLLGGSSDSPLQPLIDGFKSAIAVIKPIADFIVKGIFLYIQIQIEQFKAVALAVGDALGSFFTRIGGIFAPLVEEIKGLFGSMEGGIDILEVAKTVFGALGDVLNFVLKVVLGIIAKQIEIIVGVFRTLIGYIQTGINWIKEIAASISAWISQSSALNSVISTLSGGLSAFISSIGKVKDAFLDFLGMGDKKVEVKAAIKTEETVTTKAATTAGGDDPVAAAAKAKKEKEGKSAFELAKAQAGELKDAASVALKQFIDDQNKTILAQGRFEANEIEKRALLEKEIELQKQLAKDTDALFKKDGKIKIRLDASKGESATDVNKIIADVEGTVTPLQLKLAANNAKTQVEQLGAEINLLAYQLNERANVQITATFDPVKFTQSYNDQRIAIEDKLKAIEVLVKAGKISDSDATKLTKELNKALADGDKDYKKTKEQFDKDMNEARLAGITDAAQREIEIKVGKLIEQRDKELTNALLTEQQKLAIVKRYQDEIDAVRAKGAAKTKTGFEGMAESFSDLLKAELEGIAKSAEESKKSSEGKLKEVEKERADLTKQLTGRTLSYQDYTDKLAELDKKAADASAGVNGEKNATIQALQNTTNKLLAKGLTEEVDKQTKTFTELKGKGTEAYEALALGAAGSFASMIVSGANATNALKDTIVDTVGKLIDAHVPLIIAKFVAFLGPFALPAGYAAAQLLKGMFANVVGSFATGVVDLQGAGSETSDSIPAWLSRGESVVTARGTRQPGMKALMEHVNRGGDLSAWVVNNQGHLFEQKAETSYGKARDYAVDNSGLLRSLLYRLERIERNTNAIGLPELKTVRLDVKHDPSLAIKAMDRHAHVRKAAL